MRSAPPSRWNGAPSRHWNAIGPRDNGGGSPYTARDTHLFAVQINLTPCFTPVASPKSNGVSEALVRTFKRDYLRIDSTPDAATVLAKIDRWFEDYNENHPHSGLKMRSPREFIRAQTSTAKVSG